MICSVVGMILTFSHHNVSNVRLQPSRFPACATSYSHVYQCACNVFERRRSRDDSLILTSVVASADVHHACCCDWSGYRVSAAHKAAELHACGMSFPVFNCIRVPEVSPKMSSSSS